MLLEPTPQPIFSGVLANCHKLERVLLDMSLDGGCMFAGEDGFTTPLLVFANMPSLQYLHLRSDWQTPVATAAEVAALSASSNLTYLSLGDGEYYVLPPAAYDSWFPPGRQCPYLQHVDMGVGVLGNTAAVQRMASACPGLKELELLDPNTTDMRLESACVAASLQALTNFTALTRLHVDGGELPVGACIYQAVIGSWRQWTHLQELEMQVTYRSLEDVLVLTQLRSLRGLLLSGRSLGAFHLKVRVTSQTYRFKTFLIIKNSMIELPWTLHHIRQGDTHTCPRFAVVFMIGIGRT